MRPRFTSLRNLTAASDAELKAAALPEPAPPAPPVPRRLGSLANPWPPGAQARHPIAIEQLFEPGVYAELEAYLLDSEHAMLQAVKAAELPPELLAWQEICSSRLKELGPPAAGHSRERSFTIRHERMAAWARDIIWDTSDRDACVPLQPSDRDTVFPGTEQMDRRWLREGAAALGWSDLDLLDQLGEGGLESRSELPRDTVVARHPWRHHPGFFANAAAAIKTVHDDLGKRWVRPPPKRTKHRVGHPPTIPCHADPRDVVMRELIRAKKGADGAWELEAY